MSAQWILIRNIWPNFMLYEFSWYIGILSYVILKIVALFHAILAFLQLNILFLDKLFNIIVN
jgi:hypothetical protein